MRSDLKSHEFRLENYFNFIKGGKPNTDTPAAFHPYLNKKNSDQILDCGNVFYLIIEESSHKIVFASPRIKDVLGINAQSLVGGFSYDLHKYASSEDMAYLDKFFPEISHVIENSGRQELLNYRFSLGLKFNKPDDHKEIFILIQVRILNLDEKGKPIYTLLIFTDISLFRTENKPFCYITKIKNNQIDTVNSVFSKREIEVIKYISQGLTNIQIGNLLFISKDTVRNHRTNIFKKAKVKNMAELIFYALNNELLN